MGPMQTCMDCMGKGGGSQNGLYSYESYKKVPFFGSIGNYLKMFNGGGGKMGFLSNIGSMIGGGGGGGGIGGLLPQGGGGIGGLIPQGGGAFPPGPGGMFGMLSNLLPAGVADAANSSVFDVVDKETYVRKIKKSNYP